MSTSETNPKSNADGWAKPVDKLKVSESPKEAINLNVEGRQLSGLTHGFGQLWQKTYKVRLSGIEVTPQEVITAWKTNFPKFWPKGNDLYRAADRHPVRRSWPDQPECTWRHETLNGYYGDLCRRCVVFIYDPRRPHVCRDDYLQRL